MRKKQEKKSTIKGALTMHGKMRHDPKSQLALSIAFAKDLAPKGYTTEAVYMYKSCIEHRVDTLVFFILLICLRCWIFLPV